MSTAISHLKSNAVAYVALFVALGGTSYAAATLPPGSVGTKQLRNGSVTPAKLDRNEIGGSVAMWAQVQADGQLIASSPKATVTPYGVPGLERVTWERSVSYRCFAIVNAVNVAPLTAEASANAVGPNIHPGSTGFIVSTFSGTTPAREPVNILVICP